MNMMKNTILIEDTIRTQTRIKMIVKILQEMKFAEFVGLQFILEHTITSLKVCPPQML